MIQAQLELRIPLPQPSKSWDGKPTSPTLRSGDSLEGLLHAFYLRHSTQKNPVSLWKSLLKANGVFNRIAIV